MTKNKGKDISYKFESPQDGLRGLHEVCTKTMLHSFEREFSPLIAESYVFVTDLTMWNEVLAENPESVLFEKAEQEYLIALLNLAQGQYRNAFKGLRLVLELSVQGVHLSANLIELNEWLRSSRDTNWSSLMDANSGPFSKRFCRAFLTGIEDHVTNFSSMTGELYRELSETIHGNVPNNIPLPQSLEFNKEVFYVWHKKVKTLRMIVHFCLCCRYLNTLSPEKLLKIEEAAIDQLGHIDTIRAIFGG